MSEPGSSETRVVRKRVSHPQAVRVRLHLREQPVSYIRHLFNLYSRLVLANRVEAATSFSMRSA